MQKAVLLIVLCLCISVCTAIAQQNNFSQLQQQVADTEQAFAQTMANRDYTAFKSFLSSETVFFSGDKVLRGKEQVVEGWKRFYEKPNAPFSWKPEQVEVLESGTLALSSGPVYDPNGKLIARFNSIWRLESGKWKIIFDKGSDVCEPPKQ